MGKRRTLRKGGSSSKVQADNGSIIPLNGKKVSESSPTDWLASIKSCPTQNGNMMALNNSPYLESIASELRSGRSTPELQIKLEKFNCDNLNPATYLSCDERDSNDTETVLSPAPDSVHLVQSQTSDERDFVDTVKSDRNVSIKSPISGLDTTNFYGKTSIPFTFRKSNLNISKKGVKINQTRKNGNTGSLKRKHKSPKQSNVKNKRTKKSKKDNKDVIVDGIKKANDEKVYNNEIHNKNSECLDDSNEHCNPSGTILDIITPESSSSSSSSETEEPMSIVKPNGIINECTVNDTTEKGTSAKENHMSKSCPKGVIDDVLSELGSLHSEDSITSGFGSIKSSNLIKGENGEYYFSNSNENSPDLNANGPIKFFDTPKSSSMSNSPDSEVSSTANSERTILLFSDVKESDSSNSSPSWNGSYNSSSNTSPENHLQTSITHFFKSSSKQSNDLGSPKSKKQNRLQKSNNNKKKEQMYLDLGQRNFGHVTCTTCGMVYTHAQPDDEVEHIRHHKKFVNGLRFMGWKGEHVVKEFSDGRIIMVKPDDPSSHQKKAEEIRKVVDSELGFAVDLPYKKKESKTFLFIANKRVVGCCVATQIDKGYPVLPSTPTKDSTPDRQIAAWCCSTVPVPAQCGISKIWVWNQFRRKRVATRLIESVRTHFIYGCIISKDVLAFSDPTPDGKRLATAYIGKPEFLVFH